MEKAVWLTMYRLHLYKLELWSGNIRGLEGPWMFQDQSPGVLQVFGEEGGGQEPSAMQGGRCGPAGLWGQK